MDTNMDSTEATATENVTLGRGTTKMNPPPKKKFRINQMDRIHTNSI